MLTTCRPRGGTFTLHDPINNLPFEVDFWANSQNPNANLVGGYVALGPVSVFFGLPMSLYTGGGSASPYGGVMAPSGGPVPSAVLDDVAHTIQADLSALTWFWNVTNFSQGQPSVAGSWDPASGVYNVAWVSAFALGYGFDGLVGQWTMTGIAVATVPEPGAYVLMLSGLALVGGTACRRRAVCAPR